MQGNGRIAHKIRISISSLVVLLTGKLIDSIFHTKKCVDNELSLLVRINMKFVKEQRHSNKCLHVSFVLTFTAFYFLFRDDSSIWRIILIDIIWQRFIVGLSMSVGLKCFIVFR